MSNLSNWGPRVTWVLAAAWALVIVWRLVTLVRRRATRALSSLHPQVELTLRLCGGMVVLSFAVGYVVIALLRGAAVPYVWMSAHAWLLLVLFVANSVVFAAVVFPSHRTT